MNMRSNSDLTRLITLILLLGLAWSCAKTQVVKPPEGPFYVTPEITYLLDSPGYGGNVLGPLYRGDKVERVDAGESAWWRVELQRSGQTGWVRKELLSPDAVATVFYYVNEDSMPLLECPRSDCLPLQLLFRAELVQRVEEGDHGWWRVLVIKSRSLGWVPASGLTERIEDAQQKQPRKPYYYVAVRKLILRAKPSNRGEVIRTLRFNDQVQKIWETKDWFKVRQPASGALGWVISRDLETLPLIAPRGVPSKNELKPFKQKEEPLVEPEFM
jgi:SH3-like domain-containing protein